jgi:hypothetical protein
MIWHTNNITKLLIALVISWLCVGCTPHELPDGFGLDEARINVTLSLSFDTAMPLYQEIIMSDSRSKAQTGQSKLPTYVRYIVKVYRNNAATRVPICSYVFYQPVSEGLDFQKTVSMPRGPLTCLVWADFVDGANPADDYYYLTDDFQEIILGDRDNYSGNNDMRDTFRGQTTVTVSCSSTSVHVDMSRPMAKYEFIATDLAKFLSVMTAHYAESRSVDLDDYTCVVHYDGFMPCSFNMFTDKPADAWTGVSYTGTLQASDVEGEALLGFDYVFVNDNRDASIKAYIEVIDGVGDVVARTTTMEIPLLRGHLTTVKGEFLTSHAVGGTIIDAEFSGEYNIYIHF